MTSPRCVQLAELLSAVDAALDREDAAAAEEAVGAALRLCAELAAARVPLDREELARLSAQHARLEERAIRARDALAARLDEAGRSRRAAVAYGRR
ncbi:MAG TPA: hypothetical protein VEB43_03060 [Anaeromyxobacter sp.]|nr:hypothetical protein [Anaeromyxobacter sp.]